MDGFDNTDSILDKIADSLSSIADTLQVMSTTLSKLTSHVVDEEEAPSPPLTVAKPSLKRPAAGAKSSTKRTKLNKGKGKAAVERVSEQVISNPFDDGEEEACDDVRFPPMRGREKVMESLRRGLEANRAERLAERALVELESVRENVDNVAGPSGTNAGTIDDVAAPGMYQSVSGPNPILLVCETAANCSSCRDCLGSERCCRSCRWSQS